MQITYNDFSAKIYDLGEEHVIAVKDLIKLDGHNMSEFYRKIKNNYFLYRYKRFLNGCTKKNIAFTLEGCIELCGLFRGPNDVLIKKINELKMFLENDKPQVCPPKIDAEQLVDIELERQRQNKIKEDILKADNLAKIDMILQRVKSIEIIVGNIADKVFNEPKKEEKQDGYLRTLFKECVHEIIREELLK